MWEDTQKWIARAPNNKGDIEYFNRETGELSWRKPTEFEETVAPLNMYHLCTHIVMPLTCKPWACSWVEMVAVQAQKPVWFVSQCVPRPSFGRMGWLSVGVGGSAWSTRLHQTLEMVEWHVEVHQLSGDTPYWICTLAK